ncbi:Hint domain-containing protein [Loktanella fryxellensis]|uniref:Hint domain-containing protein n=1 Tax=Loktanella fryxellensis TaxID=245187 RepID=A0A1H8E6A7_9RHOB|nr:Hint domain-containing protein [Loktanella fryxellensis]SEN15022.1 Hint domain-containing protein [Loktanella fryxellensis]
MANYELSVRPYDGTFASLNLGGLINQSVLNGIRPSTGATITDDDGILGPDGTATFRLNDTDPPEAVTYIGSGTVSLVGALGIRLFPRDITIFQAGDQIYFYLPEGLPPLSTVTLSIEIDPDRTLTLPGLVPCFAGGTRILTRRGNIRVEDVQPGDAVIDTSGASHDVVWTGSRHINLHTLCEDNYRKLVPVRIRASLLPDHTAADDLVVSQQHRICIAHPLTEMLFGIGPCFVPAVALIGKLAELATDMTEVTYHHIMCANHVTLRANGIPAESLFLGDMLRDGLRPALQDELRLVFPQFDKLAGDRRHVTALPTLKTYEADLLARMVARSRRRTIAPAAGSRPALTPAFD